MACGSGEELEAQVGSEDCRIVVLEAGDMRSGRGLKAVRLWESYLEVVMRGREGICIPSPCPVT